MYFEINMKQRNINYNLILIIYSEIKFKNELSKTSKFR